MWEEDARQRRAALVGRQEAWEHPFYRSTVPSTVCDRKRNTHTDLASVALGKEDSKIGQGWIDGRWLLHLASMEVSEIPMDVVF